MALSVSGRPHFSHLPPFYFDHSTAIMLKRLDLHTHGNLRIQASYRHDVSVHVAGMGGAALGNAEIGGKAVADRYPTNSPFKTLNSLLTIMKSFVAIAALAASVPAVLAAPSGQDLKEVNVVIQRIKETSETDVAIVDKVSSKVLGYACSNKVDSGAFAKFPVSADINEFGAGTITIGTTTYKIHEDPSVSGGVTCTKMYDEQEVFVTCAASVPASLQLAPLNVRDKTDCFTSGAAPTIQSIANSMFAKAAAPSVAERSVEEAPRSLEERQGACGVWSSYTALEGNGDPHQNYYLNQLSENIQCGSSPSCAVGHEESKSYTIGFSVSGSIDSWIGGGFDVSESWTTGNEYTCYGAAGDTVCVWYKTAHTAYTVRNYDYNQCTGASPKGTAVVKSPNNNNKGGNYYCVMGSACRSQGEGYWDNNGPAGGP
ncbi:hypothetical protein V495_06128 [Pseudogymnoascus sp. VKM F-4514 (FW-929)]|nr:hypothetical protein V495_06128 [Pseudogymnoascus sp. VKM F-4514 (FW-929)]KFY56026.1 hypothetical protein V497_06578 [Pseudogymnoascus sp. VKM F-4516 (FW-969)]